MVAHGTPCLGPVTQAGCGAICPSYHRGCYGCFGPKETPNTAALSREWSRLGVSEREIMQIFRGVNANAEDFRKESELHARRND
jgi:coenzyme F420-reducing hydrogenase gamma subunit